MIFARTSVWPDPEPSPLALSAYFPCVLPPGKEATLLNCGKNLFPRYDQVAVLHGGSRDYAPHSNFALVFYSPGWTYMGTCSEVGFLKGLWAVDRSRILTLTVLLPYASAARTLSVIASAVCTIPYVLISRVRQPRILYFLSRPPNATLPLFAAHCCKSFGLAVGGGVCDLRLPSASRIPDVSYCGVDPVFSLLSRFSFHV